MCSQFLLFANVQVQKSCGEGDEGCSKKTVPAKVNLFVDQRIVEGPDVHMDQIYVCAELPENNVDRMILQINMEKDAEECDGAQEKQDTADCRVFYKKIGTEASGVKDQTAAQRQVPVPEQHANGNEEGTFQDSSACGGHGDECPGMVDWCRQWGLAGSDLRHNNTEQTCTDTDDEPFFSSKPKPQHYDHEKQCVNGGEKIPKMPGVIVFPDEHKPSDIIQDTAQERHSVSPVCKYGKGQIGNAPDKIHFCDLA